MDPITQYLLTNGITSGVIAVALIYIFKKWENSVGTNLGIIEKTIAVIEKSTNLLNDIKYEMRRQHEEKFELLKEIKEHRKEGAEYRAWVRNIIDRLEVKFKDE